MAKRLGANGRKRNADRKVKVKSAAKKIGMRIFIALFGITALTVLFIYSYKGIITVALNVKNSQVFDIKAIEVAGNKHIEKQMVLEKCGISDSTRSFSVKENDVRAALIKNPWIENVKVGKTLNGKVTIKIKERKPVALVNLGAIYYIDRDGYIFPLAKNVISEMPIIYGLKDTIDGSGIRKVRVDDMKRVKAFIKAALSVNNEFFQSITQIDLSDKYKIKLSFQAYTTLVELSDVNLETRLGQLLRLEKLVQSGSRLPEKIDLSYQNIAFVTMPDSVIVKKQEKAVAE
jgi:cell division protein FtsQ